MRMMKAGLFVALMAGASPAISETTIVFNNFLAPNDSLWTDVMKPWIGDIEAATDLLYTASFNTYLPKGTLPSF